MPDGFKIASAWISVDPDLTGFDQKLKAALDRSNPTVKVRTDADTTGFTAKLKAAVDLAARDATANVKIGVSGDIDAELRKLAQKMQANKISDLLDVNLNQTQIDAQLRLLKRRIEAAKLSDMLSVNLNQTQIDQQLLLLKRRIAAADLSVLVGVKADDTQAKTDIDEIKAKLDTLHDKVVHVDVKESGGGAGGLLGSLTGTSGAGSLADLTLFGKAMLALNVATGLAEPALAAMTVTVGALASSMAAAGLGLGAYAAAVQPQISAVTNVMTLQAAAATGNAAAVTKYQQALAQLSPAQKTFYTDLSGAKKSFTDWSNSLAGVTLKPLEIGLTAVNPLLHDLTPFVKDAASALDGLMTKLAAGVQSNGFKEWLQAVEPLVKPLITDIGTAVGNIVVGFGGIIKAFLPFDKTVLGGLDDFTKKFATWAGSLGDGKHTGFNALISEFQNNWPVVKKDLGDLLTIVKNVIDDMTGLSTGANSKWLFQLAEPMLALLKAASSNQDLVRVLLYLLAVKDAASKISGVFSGIKSAVAGMQSAQGFLTKLFSGQNPFTSVATPMQTAADTMAEAALKMQAAADTMAGAGTAEETAGAEQETAGTEEAAGGAGLAAGFGTALLAGGTAVAIGAAIGVAIMRAASLLLNPPTKQQTDTYNQQVSGPFKTLGNLALGSKAPTFYNMVPGGSNTPNKTGFENVWEGAFGTPSVKAPTHTDVTGAGSKGSAGASVPKDLNAMTTGAGTKPGLFAGIWDTAYQNFQREFAGKITSWFTESLPNTFTHSIPGWFDQAWGHFQSAVIAPIRGWITTTVPDYFTRTIPNWFKGAWAVFNSGVVHPVVNWFTSLPGWISSHISHIWDNVWNWFSTQATRIANWFSSLPGWVSSHVSHIWDSVYTWFTTHVVTPVINWFTGLPGWVSSHVSSLWNSVYTWFTTHVVTPVVNWFTGLPGWFAPTSRVSGTVSTAGSPPML